MMFDDHHQQCAHACSAQLSAVVPVSSQANCLTLTVADVKLAPCLPELSIHALTMAPLCLYNPAPRVDSSARFPPAELGHPHSRAALEHTADRCAAKQVGRLAQPSRAAAHATSILTLSCRTNPGRGTHMPQHIRKPSFMPHQRGTTRAWEDTTGGRSPACCTSAWISAIHRTVGMAGVDILHPFPRQTHVPRPIRQPKLTAHLCKTTRAWEDTTGGPSPACLTSAWIRAVHRMAGVAGSACCSPEGAVAKSPRPGEEAELPCASLSSPCTCRLPNQLPSMTCVGCDALPWPGCQVALKVQYQRCQGTILPRTPMQSVACRDAFCSCCEPSLWLRIFAWHSQLGRPPTWAQRRSCADSLSVCHAQGVVHGRAKILL